MSQLPAYLPVPPPEDWPHYGVGFGGAIRRAFRKYATFSGRAGLGEYWWFTLFQLLVFGVSGLLAGVLGAATSTDGGQTPGWAGVPFLILLVVFYLVVFVPSIAVTVRRLHDAGLSGWFVLLALVPLGSIVVFVFTLLPTSPVKAAQYGPPHPTPPPAYGLGGPAYGQPPYPAG